MTSRLTPGPTGYFGRAIADAHDTHGRYAESLDVIPQLGRNVVPPDWLPWLLRDAGLERLMPYVDWSVLWEKGRAWLPTRGTAQASIDALGWIGWSIDFEYGAAGTQLYDHYQIHLDRVPWRSELERMIPVEDFARTEDSKFLRLISGYDVRPVRGGRSLFARALFGRHSGVDVRPDWPRLSFKVHVTLHTPSTSRALTAETLTVSTYATRRGDIIFGRSRFASKATRGPVFGMQLSETTKATVGVGHRAAETLRPVAGLVAGRSIIGRRQSVHIALRKVLGQHAIWGRTRIGTLWRLATVEQLLAVPEPITLAAAGQVVPTARTSEILTDNAHVVRGDRLARISDKPDAVPMLAAIGNLSNAPWSGLPWGDEPWGESPRALATDKITET